MIIGVLTLELAIEGSMSLKDKRRAVRSLKDRLAHRHNISIAETDYLDEHRRAELGIAMVSNDAQFVESCLSKIVNEAGRHRHASLVDYSIELI